MVAVRPADSKRLAPASRQRSASRVVAAWSPVAPVTRKEPRRALSARSRASEHLMAALLLPTDHSSAVGTTPVDLLQDWASGPERQRPDVTPVAVGPRAAARSARRRSTVPDESDQA